MLVSKQLTDTLLDKARIITKESLEIRYECRHTICISRMLKVSGNGVIALYIFLSFVSIARYAQAATYYPPSEAQGGWRSLVTPNTNPSATEKQQILAITGVDWDKLKLAWNYVAPHTSALFVVRNGWVVGNWGSAGGFYLNSISKSITGAALASMFTQSAAGTDPIIGPDDFVYQHLPSSWGDANPARQAIQIKHLMTHSSGLLTDQGVGPSCDYFTQQPVVAPPGTLWAYSNSNALLESTIVHWKSGLSLKDYFNQQIAGPIGAQPVDFIEDCGESGGQGGGYWGAQSLARLSYLLMKEGNWNGNQIISEPFLSQLTNWAPFLANAASDPLSATYSDFAQGKDVSTYSWWSNLTGEVQGTTWPSDTLCASGAAKEIVCASPSLDLLYVRLGEDPPIAPQEFFMTLAASITNSISASSPPPPPPAPTSTDLGITLDNGDGICSAPRANWF